MHGALSRGFDEPKIQGRSRGREGGATTPLPTDLLLIIRDGMAILRTPEQEGKEVPEDALVMIGVASCWGDKKWRKMMLAIAYDEADKGHLDGLIETPSHERPN